MRYLTGLLLLTVLIAGCAEPAPPVAVPLDDAALSTDWGCGYGFWAGTADQTAGVFIEYLAYDHAAAGGVPEDETLPSDGWRAELVLGRDLFANWCDDVMEEGEPVAVRDAVYPIVAGTFTVAGTVGPFGCPGSLTLRATDLEAERTDGDRIPIGDLEIVNTAWGCFAG